jgi:hypothetical protein
MIGAAGVNRECTGKGACDGGVPVMCSGPESCSVAGDVCCAEFGTMGTGKANVTCTTRAACNGLILCQTSNDCPDMGECRMGFGGFMFCRRHRPDGGFGPPDGGMMPPDSGPG